MKRFFKLSASVSLPLLFFLVLIIFQPLFLHEAVVSLDTLGLVVFIDPGHGGYDPGSSKDSVLEKDINLAISTKLYEKMLGEGMMTLIARNDDYDLSSAFSKNHKMDDLKKRVAMINESGANMLVSIHLNSMRDSSIYGPMVYYRANDETSKVLAQTIQDELNQLSDLNKIIHEENYYLFNKTMIPSVLIECGFLSNDVERNKLISDKYQEQIATSIYNGIHSYWQDQAGRDLQDYRQ